MPELRWLPEAREELFVIYVQLGLGSRTAATRFVDRIERLAGQLATFRALDDGVLSSALDLGASP